MKKHILVITEKKPDLDYLLSMFERSGAPFKCTYASRAEQALEMLRYLSTDIVFIGHHQAGIDALQLISAIRFEPSWRQLKICLFGETFSEETLKMAKILGVSLCLERNAGEEEFYYRVCDILHAGIACQYVMSEK